MRAFTAFVLVSLCLCACSDSKPGPADAAADGLDSGGPMPDAAVALDARAGDPASDAGAPDAQPAASDASDLPDAGSTDSGETQDSGEDLACASEVTPHTFASATGDANLLVIFDRSASTQQDWNGLPQYQAASQALSAALEPIENEVSAAGLFFPSVNPADPVGCVCDPNNFMHLLPGGCCVPQGPISCLVNALEESDQIAWTTGSAFRAALPAHAMPIQGGGTPLQTACEVSDAALGLRPVGAPTSVLLLTDDDPNCDTNNEQVVAYAQNWASQGVPTHVVGFASEIMAADFLDRIASAGSTFTAHRVGDSAQLADALERVMQESVRSADVCTITLASAAADDLALIGELDGIHYRALRGADTWSLAGDTRHVTLAAELCASARGGALHSLRFVRGCADLPSWPLDLNDDAGL